MSNTPANSLNITQPGFSLFNASSGFFAPNKILSLTDDFIGDGNNYDLPWSFLTSFVTVDSTTTNPGITALATAPLYGLILTDVANIDTFALGAGIIYENFILDLVSLSDNVNTYVAYVGFVDHGASLGSITRGVYFQYTDTVNSGNWQIICNDGVTTTTVNTAVAASTGFHNYGIIINANATSVSFTIDGSIVGTAITTHIPTNPISPGIIFTSSAGTPSNPLIDLFYMTNVLTTAR